MCVLCGGVFRTQPGLCMKGVECWVCVWEWMFVVGCSESVLICKTLECILCKYVPAVKRDVRAACAVREHMPFDSLCSQDTVSNGTNHGSVQI